MNGESNQHNSAQSMLTTTTTTTVRKQPWENTIARDNNIVNENQGATQGSQLSQSQSILQPQNPKKQTKQNSTGQKKGAATKGATQRTSNSKPRKKTLKVTPKMKPVGATTRRSNTQRSQVNEGETQPIGLATNRTESADSQRLNEQHEQISSGATRPDANI